MFYDGKFYFGPVLVFVSPEKYVVKFMADIRCQTEISKWPQLKDIEAQHVFRWDFSVVPASNNLNFCQVCFWYC